MENRSKALQELDLALSKIDKVVENISLEEKGTAKPIIKKLGIVVAELLHTKKIITDLDPVSYTHLTLPTIYSV